MIRKQIYIPEFLHSRVDQLAKHQGASFAEMVRTLLVERLDEIRNQDSSGKSALRAIANIQATKGPTDLYKNHNKHLYGSTNE